jgi:hypothetical protein
VIEIRVGAIQSVFKGAVLITNPSEHLYIQDLMLARTFWDGKVWRIVDNRARTVLANMFVELHRGTTFRRSTSGT